MEIAKQLSVFLANKPGTLAAVCEELARAKVNIFALTITDTVDHSVVRMVLSDTEKALHIFEERGVLAVQSNVLMITNDNKPGSLGAIASRLAKAKINIEYAYLATSPGDFSMQLENFTLLLMFHMYGTSLPALCKLKYSGDFVRLQSTENSTVEKSCQCLWLNVIFMDPKKQEIY